mgnify:CR=1 FL=1
MLDNFKKHYPQLKNEISDYRPLSNVFIPNNRKGITIFLKNGDIIQYYPMETYKTEFIEELETLYKKYGLCVDNANESLKIKFILKASNN